MFKFQFKFHSISTLLADVVPHLQQVGGFLVMSFVKAALHQGNNWQHVGCNIF
jgi:hypothetical protein